jgi:hypothetical protein
MKVILRVAVLLLVAGCGKKAPLAEGLEAGVAVTGAAGPGAAATGRFDAAEIAVPAGKSKLHVAWSVPDGTDINDDAPFGVRWASSDGLVSPPSDIRGYGKDVKDGFDVPIDVLPTAVGAKLGGDVNLVVCDIATHAVCVPIKRELVLTFAVGKGGPDGRVTLPLPKAKP